jgi:hypothetical protein
MMNTRVSISEFKAAEKHYAEKNIMLGTYIFSKDMNVLLKPTLEKDSSRKILGYVNLKTMKEIML